MQVCHYPSEKCARVQGCNIGKVCNFVNKQVFKYVDQILFRLKGEPKGQLYCVSVQTNLLIGFCYFVTYLPHSYSRKQSQTVLVNKLSLRDKDWRKKKQNFVETNN